MLNVTFFFAALDCRLFETEIIPSSFLFLIKTLSIVYQLCSGACILCEVLKSGGMWNKIVDKLVVSTELEILYC